MEAVVDIKKLPKQTRLATGKIKKTAGSVACGPETSSLF
jgi:hypothetical protein